MSTQLSHHFQASPAVQGADDVTIPQFYSQANFLRAFVVPRLMLLFTAEGWSTQTYAFNYALLIDL